MPFFIYASQLQVVAYNLRYENNTLENVQRNDLQMHGKKPQRTAATAQPIGLLLMEVTQSWKTR